MKKLFVSILILLSLLNFGFSETENSNFKKGKLSNGMKYYVLPEAVTENRITLGLLVKAGSCMEDDDQKGVAHFIEHMCFNSTEDFQMYEFRSFTDSIGMTFGRDVNAITDYEKTLFYVTIPSDNVEYLNKVLLWFNNIVGGKLLFKEDEVEKEKKIVIEEWRRRSAYTERYEQNVLNKCHIKNTRYSERPVLGNEESIRNVSIERVKDFYNEWYRPDNISLIVVGDVNTFAIEKNIRNNFSKIKKQSKPIRKIDISFPIQENTTLIFADPDIKNTSIYIEERIDESKYKSKDERFKMNCILPIIIGVYNPNLNVLNNKANSPLFEASMNSGYIKSSKNGFAYIHISPKDNQLEDSMHWVKNEFLRIKTYGLSEKEFKLYKTRYITGLEKSKEKKLQYTNLNYVYAIAESIMNNEDYINLEEEIDKKILILNQLKYEDFNNYIKNFFSSEGNNILLMCNDKSNIDVTENQLENYWRDYHPKVSPYVEENLPDELMERPKVKAAIISKNKNNILDCNEYVFENGVKVITKKTTFEKDKIYFSAMSEGGTNIYENNDYPSALLCTDYFFNSGIAGYTRSQYYKIKNDKKYDVSCRLYRNEEEIYGNSDKKSLESMLQYVNLVFTSPYFTDNGWNTTYQNYEKKYTQKTDTTDDVFYNKINSILYNDELRYNNRVTKEFIDLLDKNRSREIFLERFSNAADFTFVFTGDFNENKLIQLCSYYIGTIYGNENEKEKSVLRDYSFPKNKEYEVVKKGEKNSSIYIGFGGDIPYSEDSYERRKDIELFTLVGKYLTNRFTKTIREEKNGTYSISEQININVYPLSNFKDSYFFNCEPGREKELIDYIFMNLKALKENEISDEDFNNLKTNFELSIIQNESTNEYWKNLILRCYVFKTLFPEIIKDRNIVLDMITKENVMEYLNKYYNEENSVVVVREPE